MISIDDHPPSDPSSSDNHNQTHHHHQQQQISHDLKINSDDKAQASVSDTDLKSPDADLDETNAPLLPSFSIRDHVFGLRSKNVVCNWPFSATSLQLCLRNGVKNLLPPFQSLDLLRNNSSISRCGLENHFRDKEIVSSSDGKPLDDQFKSVTSDAAKSIRELASGSVGTNSSGSKRDKGSQSRSKDKQPASSHKIENTSTQTIIKKSRLVMKLNSGVESVEEVAPNSFIVSETMASKVCPVCKIFSSSSNTTLNAHIDQCLTGEASMKWTDNPKVIVKHRIKPRKTRLMVDIYETAPHCTVEELDRRNGTSWATNSSFPAQEFQFQGDEEKEEKEEPKMTTINHEVADNEGDVYIDTDGTKVRILSVPKAGSSDNHGARKLLKGVKGCKIVVGKKKSNIYKQKHPQKYLKLGDNGQSCSPKPPRGGAEARNGQEEDVAMAENCSKEERGREPVKARVHMNVSDLAIVRPPWACSKRTGLVKKFNGKHRTRGLQSHAAKDLFVENDKSSSRSNNIVSSQSRKKMRTSSPLIGKPDTSSRKAEVNSSVLMKPSSRHSRKEGTYMDDDHEDSRDASPSRHSDCADIRPTSSKFSTLRKSRSFSAAKFSLKRKFSAVEKSHAHCLLNEKSVDGHVSSKKQSIMEEDTAARKEDDAKILEERSITSKSSNGESSARIETATEDALQDVESVRNETLPDTEQVCVVPPPNMIDAKESLMGLNNSFDPEFSKLVNQHDNKFDLRECVKLYQDQLCSTNRAPDGKNIFGNDIEDGTEDVEKNESYYQEVDPIPIPGPPGSFLPSPGGDMVSEEIQANSSLTTTTRVLSTENQHHHDMMDRDSMSNSPVSTVSNPSMARSDSRSSDKLSYRSTSVQDDAKPGSSGVKTFLNGGDWRSSDTSFTEKGPSPASFKNDQPCCCSRKETASSYLAASNYQESSFLRKQPLESNRSQSGLSCKSDMFLLSNYPTSQPPETVMFPTTKKLPVYSDCDSAASPTKPVLRLMGKNLTVVKTDEDVSSLSPQQFRPPQSNPMSQQFRTGQTEERGSFSHGYPQGPVIFNQYKNGYESQHFNLQPPINMRSHVDLKPNIHGGFMASVDRYGHGNGNHPHLGPMMPHARSHGHNNGFNSQAARGRNVYNGPNPMKEIIVIDDSPENEADDSMRNEYLRRNRVPSSLIDSSPGPMNQLYTMYGGGGGGPCPSMFRGGSFQNCTPAAAGSSGMMHIGSSASPSHMRSATTYYPPPSHP